MASPGAALIDQKDVVAARIEEGPVEDLGSAPGAAVQEENRLPALRPDFLDLAPMPIADVEHAGVKGAEGFGEGLHRTC